MTYYRRKLGVMEMNISKLIPGIGRERTDRYSSLKRLLMVPLMESSAQRRDIVRSKEMLLMKYGGKVPESERSLEDMV